MTTAIKELFRQHLSRKDVLDKDANKHFSIYSKVPNNHLHGIIVYLGMISFFIHVGDKNV